MTLNEMIEEYDNLSDERKVEACKKFLKEVSESNVDYLIYTILSWMEDVAELENEDFFGTEGMDI